MRLLNKRGIMGKLLSAIPVLFILFFVIIIFFVLTASMSGTLFSSGSGNSLTLSPVLLPPSPLLFQEIAFPVQEKGQTLLVSDSLILWDKGQITPEQLSSALEKLPVPDGTCLALAAALDSNPSDVSFSIDGAPGNKLVLFLEFHNGKVTNRWWVYSYLSDYKKANLLYPLQLTYLSGGKSRTVFAESYLGPCLSAAGGSS